MVALHLKKWAISRYLLHIRKQKVIKSYESRIALKLEWLLNSTYAETNGWSYGADGRWYWNDVLRYFYINAMALSSKNIDEIQTYKSVAEYMSDQNTQFEIKIPLVLWIHFSKDLTKSWISDNINFKERCPSGLRSWSWKPVMSKGTVGSNPTLSAIFFICEII